MDPAIQYCTTADGVSIGCYAAGDGPPLLILPYLPMSHLGLEWQVPPLRAWMSWLAGHRRVIRYDARGTGVSERGVMNLSLDDHLHDIDAVLEKFSVERCDVLAGSFAGPIALAYAARHPAAVRQLVLWTTHATLAEVRASISVEMLEQRKAIDELRQVDADLFLRAWLHRAVGWLDGAHGDMAFELVRESVDAESFPRLLAAYANFDAVADLPQVEAPTLVLQRRDFVGSHVDVARNLAARVKDSRLVVFEGTSVVPFTSDAPLILETIDDFLGNEGVTRRRQVPSQANDAPLMRTILFTDIEGHTTMTQRLGDARARDVLRAHERVTRAALHAHGGTEVKTLGDGFLASFTSAARALECAMAIQHGFAEQARSTGDEPGLRVRVGLNAGEPIAEDGDLFGTSVIVASRITDAAAGGHVLVANVVRELVSGKGFEFLDRGNVTLRGFDEPTHIWELRWDV